MGYFLDQFPLVNDQIDDGKRLVARLVEEGISVKAAFWVKESETGKWFLYIASALVGRDGDTLAAYGRLLPVIRQMPQPFDINPFRVKAVGRSSPIAKAVLALQEHHPGQRGFYHEGTQLGDRYIEGAYIYPPVNALSAP
jgi:hypothetical protein